MKHIYYVQNDEKGISRVLTGKYFQYFSSSGKKISASTTLKRIKNLKIPPAYQKVWICRNSRGHIQAHGVDDKGRKQYIYHTDWLAYQEKLKYNHLVKFGKALPHLRKKIKQHLLSKQLTKNKVIAVVITMLDKTNIRIGSPQYESFGLLTLRKRHVKIRGSRILLDFQGKSNINWHLKVDDKKLAKLLKKLETKPGYTLFKYSDTKNNFCNLTVSDVNDYLRKYTKEDITAKEFRTWKGSVLFLKYLLQNKNANLKIAHNFCLEKVSRILFNTVNVCKNSYIHPFLLNISFSKLPLLLKNKKCVPNIFFNKYEQQLLFLLKSIGN